MSQVLDVILSHLLSPEQALELPREQGIPADW